MRYKRDCRFDPCALSKDELMLLSERTNAMVAEGAGHDGYLLFSAVTGQLDISSESLSELLTADDLPSLYAR